MIVFCLAALSAGLLPELTQPFPTSHESFNPGLLLGDQALHEVGPFLLVGLHTLRREQLANLRNAPRFTVRDSLNLILQIR